MVACGRADGYFGAGFHIWDIAAAGLIVTEAGGTTVDMKGTGKNYAFKKLHRIFVISCNQ